ncbi:MAG TPA: glycerol-3-phosphate 1-O-acyltransferase PlsY [Kofleriaceae bacterium]|nr:glycerol-3-phosphate 1-O-acyltransferase PlsY [Kofleriaceae bacterium]
MALAALFVAGAYLLGSIPFGLLFARLRGVDIRAVGSGNIGATNVARNLGKRLGVVVLLCDALKGALPVALALAIGLGDRAGDAALAVTGGAAICGHCFPVWLKFRGGKGVATAFGVFLAASPLAALAGFLAFAILYALTRVASIGSLGAALVIPAFIAVTDRPQWQLGLALFGAAIVIFKHRKNVARLLHGNELKV